MSDPAQQQTDALSSLGAKIREAILLAISQGPERVTVRQVAQIFGTIDAQVMTAHAQGVADGMAQAKRVEQMQNGPDDPTTREFVDVPVADTEVHP